MVLLRSLTKLLSFDRVICCLQVCRGLFSEHVLYREDLIKQLELLFCRLLVLVRDHFTIEFSDVLEPVDKEALQ